MKKNIFKLVVCTISLTSSALMVSCGGGGGDETPAVTPPTNTSYLINSSQVTTTQGPYATINHYDYKLPAAVDDTILTGVPTEIWGRLYLPQNKSTSPLPLIVVLHGNHSTCGQGSPIVPTSCEYTTSGTCSNGDTVINNHLGYEYLATALASWGYAVVSINANRGITCGTPVAGDSGLNLARGRLILKHLSLLQKWSTGSNSVDPNLASALTSASKQIDFSQIGLLGHSRAGEGVRAAYNLYRDAGSTWQTEVPNLGFRAIFEIGPVDGQTSRVLNADGVAWNALLPSCDGDVSNLEGMKPYDRMLNSSTETPYPKTMFVVHGANHDFYNTTWQNSDNTTGCVGATKLWTDGSSGSTTQQQTAIQTVVPFFRSYLGTGFGGNDVPSANIVGTQLQLANVLDPSVALPSALTTITQFDRTFYLSPNAKLEFRAEDFKNTDGNGSLGFPHEIQNVIVKHVNIPEHDKDLMAASIQWNSINTFFQDDWTAANDGLDLSAAQTLDFRVGRANSSLNPNAGTDFTIQLMYFDGWTSTPVQLSSVVPLLTGPIGITGDLHETLQTVRIPMTSFGALKKVQAVRFSFGTTPTGLIYLADIGVTRFPTFADAATFIKDLMPPGFGLSSANNIWDTPPPMVGPTSVIAGPTEKIESVASTSEKDTEVEVFNADGFPVRDCLSELRVGNKILAVGGSYNHKGGDLHYLTFKVSGSELSGSESKLKVAQHAAKDQTRMLPAQVKNKSVMSR